MTAQSMPRPGDPLRANLSFADAERLRDDLYVADSLLDVLCRALADVNDDQGAHERNVVRLAREKITAAAEALDCSLLPREGARMNARAARHTPPAIYGGRQLPVPHADVWLRVNWWDEHRASVVYHGTPEQLIAAGCAEPGMVVRGRPGLRRFDSDGDKFGLSVRRDGRVRLWRCKAIGTARALPGVADWIERARPFEEVAALAREAFARIEAGATLH